MKVLLSWINDYVDISKVELKQITKGLTDSGFEVEEIIDKSAGLENIVVAQITSIERHPNADKLVICQADYGFDKTQVVTHADNMKVGDKVPLALEGAHLPNGVEIKNGSLRGVASNGMFCAGEELGIDNSIYEGAEVDGLLILNPNEEIGMPIAKVLGLDEVILDINVLPNRSDCNSIYGIAKEIGAILGLPIKPLDLSYNTSSHKKVNVNVEDFDMCPRYEAVVVENIKNQPSPKYMQKRLSLLGHTPHNLFVDITNYILLEVGQPMHVFDLERIKGNTINVRRAKQGETLLTLDEKEHKLTPNNLVIADTEKPLVIAGIMGGIHSGTTLETTNVMLESANFNYVNIRHSSYELSLSSDSSIRYAKGVFIENTDIGLKRALNIISSLNVGNISDVIVDVRNSLPVKRTVISEIQKINERLGLEIQKETMLDILNRLGIETVEKNGSLISMIPPDRTDIERDCDICEEVGRIYGLDKVSIDETAPTKFSSVGEITNKQKNINRIKIACASNGFYETLTWQFGSPKTIEKAGLKVEEHIKVLNPIGLDYSVIRRSLMPGMLNTISFNLKQGNKELRLFELARVFLAKQLPITELPDEHENLCLSLTGSYNFYDLKNKLNLIMAEIGIELEYRQATNAMFHPGISADIYLYNKKIGEIGEIHPTIRNNFEINQKVYMAEISLASFQDRLNDKHICKPIDKLPSIERDLAIIVDKDVSASKIISTTLNADKVKISKCKVFDVYESDALGNDKKSVAIRFSIRQTDKTLTDNEILEVMQNVLNAQIKENNAKLR